jgi:DNA polymerase-3 subunit beta
MNLIIERTALANAMSRLAGIVDRKQVIPILGNAMLTAEGDRLTLRVTNLDIEAMESIPAAVTTPGAITVPVDKLSEIARNLPTGSQITMAQDELRMKVSAGRSRFVLSVLSPAGFPSLWDDEWTRTFSIDAESARYLIGRVDFAQTPAGVSDDYLQGINLALFEGKLRLVATNRHMIAYRDGPEMEAFDAITVPTAMVAQMNSLLASVAGEVEISISRNKIRLRAADTVITSKLIDASLKFPDYMRAVPAPDALPLTARVKVADLVGAITRARIASQGLKDNTVRFTFKPGALAVSARNTEAEAFDEIDAEYDGDEVTIALNPPYMLDILGNIGGEVAETHFKDNDAAMTWHAVDDAAGLVTIMPQRVGV